MLNYTLLATLGYLFSCLYLDRYSRSGLRMIAQGSSKVLLLTVQSLMLGHRWLHFLFSNLRVQDMYVLRLL